MRMPVALRPVPATGDKGHASDRSRGTVLLQGCNVFEWAGCAAAVAGCAALSGPALVACVAAAAPGCVKCVT